MSEAQETMNADRWQRLNEVFAAVRETEPGRQSEILRQACGGDEQLRREAEAIVAAAREADSRGFLKSDVFAAGAQVLIANEIPPGTVIGPYRVVREIGRGGMGAVYLATREGFHQQVALKIIKRGMDTEATVRRFVQERDVLASLNHRNIARLLDGGTTDGLPFIALEYVEGETITAFCDHKRLTIDDRLVLFRKVCAAVAYAHQNLVVHRDIKPSNILIASDGEPKLLDFGIAKLLSPDWFGVTMEQTATGANLLTPEYASPEQIRGDKITTASDVYSLGVLLYELLCGHRPFRFKLGSAGEMLQVISERQPPAPSTAALTREEIALPEGATRRILSADTVAEMRSEKPARLQRKLAGDLDNIVLMALRKEPERRYNSVLQFAEDVRRHLDGLPVAARPATFSYRTSKFIERNRTATVFATVALLAILVGLSVAVWQAVVARQQWARAERRSNEVRRLTNTLLKDLKNDVVALPGSAKATEKLSKVSIEYLDGLAQETNDPAVLKQLSEAYVLLGKHLGYNNRNPDEIRANISRGLEISRRLVADAPKDLEAKKLLAMNLVEYDFFCEKDPAEKLKLNQERARLLEEVTAAAPDDPDAYAELGQAHNTLKYLLYLYERPDEALNYSRLAVRAWERQVQLLEKTPPTVSQRDALSLVYTKLGSTYIEEFKDLKAAEAYYRKALAEADALKSEHPDYRLAWARLAAANHGLADLRDQQGDYQSAVDYFRECLRVFKEGNAQNPDQTSFGAEVTFRLRLAENLYRTGHASDASQMLRDAVAANKRMDGLFGETAATIAIRDAGFLRASGKVYAVFERTSAALANYREAENLWKKVVAIEPQRQASVQSELARLSLDWGDLYAEHAGGQPEARDQYQKAVNIFSQLKNDNQIGLDDLRLLGKAQAKLQTLAG
ncbi:MAG: eukaryotic-like serine/threonine-protein kinase [Blastocatellia bacterium]|nr:eukaryotic-like serine/threonine-protein kinase [Blastocatellia bacterium]